MFGFSRGQRGAGPHRLIVGTLAVVAVLIGADSWRTWQARSDDIEQQQVDIANLARSLAQHAHDLFQTTDTLISGLRAMREADGVAQDKAEPVHLMLARHVETMPIIRDIMAFDKTGHLVVNAVRNSARLTGSAGGVSDRDYFLYHQTHADRDLHVGNPLRSRVDGVWAIPLTRRVDGPGGQFAGMVMGSLSVDMLRAFYGQFNVGPSGSITLESTSGVLITRQPLGSAIPGTTMLAAKSFLDLVQREPAGNVDFISTADGVHRTGSYRKVEGLPLLILVANAFDDVLVGWRSDAINHIALDACAAIALLILAARLLRQTELRRRSELAAQSKERMFRLLADNSGDVIIKLDGDLRRVYVSPSSERLFGYPPEELLNGLAGQTCHPEDQEALGEHMAALARGADTAPIGYRIRCKDGAYLWVEAVASKIDDDHGYIIVLRDITSRKQAEAKLHKANTELHRLVMRDGLTGIANRRAFDLALEKEFRRAVRGQNPLALLMIDVDHFKAFNDRYGHPAGDACLRSVAEILDRELRRPGDLVARYGGEEFAAVLPETDYAGATSLGEQIRRAVCDVAIEHGGSAQSLVTVSVGVAAVWPQRERLPTELVDLADGALYRAKSSGRNRVCSALETASVAATFLTPAAESPVIARLPARALEHGAI